MIGEPENAPKIFDWYVAMLEFVKFQFEHTRERFYQTAKLHLAVSGGILALVSFAISRERLALVLAIFLCGVGIWLCTTWFRQISVATEWETRWFSSVKRMEETPEFANVVGTQLKVFADKEISRSFEPDFVVRHGTTARLYRGFARGFLVLYILVFIGSTTYLLYPQLFTHTGTKEVPPLKCQNLDPASHPIHADQQS